MRYMFEGILPNYCGRKATLSDGTSSDQDCFLLIAPYYENEVLEICVYFCELQSPVLLY